MEKISICKVLNRLLIVAFLGALYPFATQTLTAQVVDAEPDQAQAACSDQYQAVESWALDDALRLLECANDGTLSSGVTYWLHWYAAHRLYEDRADYSGSAALAEHWLEKHTMFSTSQDSANQAIMHHLAGRGIRRTGRLVDTIKHYEAGLRFSQALEPIRQLRLLRDVGNYYYRLGDALQADILYGLAEVLIASVDTLDEQTQEQIGWLLTERAATSNALGRFKLAELQASRAIQLRSGEGRNFARVEQAYAQAHLREGEAARYTLVLLAGLGGDRLASYANLLLGSLYRHQGDTTAAMLAWVEAEQLAIVAGAEDHLHSARDSVSQYLPPRILAAQDQSANGIWLLLGAFLAGIAVMGIVGWRLRIPYPGENCIQVIENKDFKYLLDGTIISWEMRKTVNRDDL